MKSGKFVIIELWDGFPEKIHGLYSDKTKAQEALKLVVKDFVGGEWGKMDEIKRNQVVVNEDRGYEFYIDELITGRIEV